MRRFLFLLPLLLLWPVTAQAQQPLVLSSCGPTAFFTAGQSGRLTVNTKGEFCGTSSGSAATIADGADVAQGTTTDSACATDNGTCTLIALTKRNNQRLTTLIAGIPVTNAGTFAVQATLPTTPTIAAGNGVVLAPASTSTAAFTITNATSAALEATRAAKASPGNVYGAYATAIAGGTAGFLVGYNATTCPADGAVTAALVLDVCVIDTTSKGCSISRPGPPRNYSVGICFYITTGASPFANKATGTDTGYISVDYN